MGWKREPCWRTEILKLRRAYLQKLQSMTRLALLAAFLPCVNALLPAKALRNGRRPSTSLNILSPEAMVSLQKATNKAEFEDTVAKYAKQKRLSTRDAELEYARYLLDPDKFVLDAAANSKGVVEQRQRRPENIQQAGFGQRRSPLLQAYIDEDPTGATEKRISDFERSNTIKACAIIACLFVFVITWDPVVP